MDVTGNGNIANMTVTYRQAVREALDIDSFDLLNLLIGLNEAFGVEIPERDYGQLTTIEKTVDYIEARVAAPNRP